MILISYCVSTIIIREIIVILNLITFKNFGLGLKLKELPKQPNLREILKTSLTILVTAETVDLIFYKQAFYLSIPLALLAGAFTVVAPEAYRNMKEAKSK